MLEPNVVKATRSVPRRGRGSNPSDLSDTLTKLLLPWSIVGPFAIAQGVQSSLKLGLHIMINYHIDKLVFPSLLNYGTDRRGSVPPYRICSPILFTPPIPRLPLRPPLRSASGRRGYGGANWLA